MLIALLIILAFSIYLWKQQEINELKKEQALKDKLLIERANELLAQNDQQLLRSLAQPFSWAVREEMLRNNYEQINNYLGQFIQQPQFQLALITNANDTVIVSTNQKHVGNPISQFFPEKYARQTQITTYALDSTRLLLISPIMGYTNRLGTLMLTYDQQHQLSLPEVDPL